jgi:hypothetical protein
MLSFGKSLAFGVLGAWLGLTPAALSAQSYVESAATRRAEPAPNSSSNEVNSVTTARTKSALSEVELEDLNAKRAAVEKVQRETDGKILSVRSVRTGKQRSYRIKVLTRAGRVHVVQIASAELSSATDVPTAPKSVTKDQ